MSVTSSLGYNPRRKLLGCFQGFCRQCPVESLYQNTVLLQPPDCPALWALASTTLGIISFDDLIGKWQFVDGIPTYCFNFLWLLVNNFFICLLTLWTFYLFDSDVSVIICVYLYYLFVTLRILFSSRNATDMLSKCFAFIYGAFWHT